MLKCLIVLTNKDCSKFAVPVRTKECGLVVDIDMDTAYMEMAMQEVEKLVGKPVDCIEVGYQMTSRKGICPSLVFLFVAVIDSTPKDYVWVEDYEALNRCPGTMMESPDCMIFNNLLSAVRDVVREVTSDEPV